MNWLKDLLEETSYEFYLQNNPEMVKGIRTLLVAGEKPSKIRKWCEGIVGRSLTANMVGHMIDYANKQIKN